MFLPLGFTCREWTSKPAHFGYKTSNPDHDVIKLDLAKHIRDIDGIAVATRFGAIQQATAA